MNLIEESFENKNENKNENKKSKATTIILIAIILIVLIIIGISTYLVYIQKTALRVLLNGQESEQFKQLLRIEENGVVYFPIKEVASYFDYESYNGEYGNKSEDQSKCYVQGDYEIANFSLNSNEIYKVNLEDNNENYESVYIEEPVKAINGVLYASSEAMEEAFNVSFEYDQKNNRIYVYTLPYLVEVYNSKVINYGYTGISDVFANQKALIEGIIIVKNEKEKYGVIDNSGNTILEDKYDDILFLENTGDFLVTDNNKKGILSKTRETKVEVIYDDIQLMDMESELYLVKKDNKYGVIDFNGNIKIHIENDQIGIDTASFEKNDLKSSYILADNLIPVKKGQYWGLFDKKGKKIVDYKYDNLGCTTVNNRSELSLLIIPNYNAIVVGKDKKYTLINSAGEELFGMVADSIYMTIDAEEKNYYISFQGNQINAIEFMDSIGMGTNSNNRSNSKNNEQNQQSTNDEQDSQESSDQEGQYNNNQNANEENIEDESNEGNEEQINEQNEEENNSQQYSEDDSQENE